MDSEPMLLCALIVGPSKLPRYTEVQSLEWLTINVLWSRDTHTLHCDANPQISDVCWSAIYLDTL